MPSNAREGFKASLERDITSLLRAHEDTASQRGRQPRWLQGVRRGTIVLLTAHLEAYVEDVIEEGLLFMSSSRLEASDYPSGFRTYVLLLELRRTVGSLGLDTAHDIGEFRDQWNSSWIPTEADIPFEDLEKDFGFPTPDNLNDALRLFDIQDFLGEIRMQMQNQVVDPEALLSELVGRRGGLAHGSGPTPKFDTVRRLRKFTLQLTDHIDRNLRAAIDATTPGQAPW